MKEIQKFEQEYGGHLGVMAKNLRTGEEVRYNAGERFPTASVIKLPVMVAYYQAVSEGRLDAAQRITLAASDKKPSLLQQLGDGLTLTIQDAVRLMIVLSDNTATNLVLDRLADTHAGRLQTVNDLMTRLGLKNTRLLNRLYSWDTKQPTPEGIRYGIGVSTPEDMVVLMEGLYRKTLINEKASEAMTGVLQAQFYDDMIPRLLPGQECERFSVAHKTGFVQETKVDVGLILSDRADIALAIFIDKHPDHAEGLNNTGLLLAAHVSRAIWNHFTGMTGYTPGRVNTAHVDWNMIPGGKWGIWRSPAAPFPHPERANGFTRSDSTRYPYFPHYADSSLVVFVPEKLKPSENGVNLIVHFHGHMNDNMGVLEKYRIPQGMIAEGTNAILVLPQGPYRARDSFCGKMEDPGGLQRMVNDVLATMKKEEVIKEAKLDKLILAAHSGGYRPVAFCLDRGGLNAHITDLFLFDAFYGNFEFYRAWLLAGKGNINAAYTDHLAEEHTSFAAALDPQAATRFRITHTPVEHDQVLQEFLRPWLAQLPGTWKITP
jgi:beta-lactamase class A